jgi:diguanylate cyclase (GGDEF)-like protein
LIGLLTTNSSLVLAMCMLLDLEPLAVPLLGGVVLVLLLTYRAHSSRLIQRLHEQARHDPLTGLANRVQFAERLEARLAEPGAEVAIALMDLDRFKEINDTLGHQSGDRALVEVARRLRATIRDSTLAVRLGGDEFALLAGGAHSRQDLEAFCHRIREAVGAPMEIDGIRVTMGASIGIAVASHDGDNAETLLRRADIAMYAAKSRRSGGVCFYDATRDENTPRRLSLISDLRSAIEDGQLVAEFQPKLSLQTGSVVGVEALCRWEHPTHGDVLPDEFIPLADEIGLGGGLTEFMLRASIDHALRWQQAGLDWSVAVNVSMHTLLGDDLVGVVRRAVQASPVRAAGITLEITETHVMSDPGRVLRALTELSDLGVRISVDDFGTGYSSLAHLQRLPVDEVKIDKEFVQLLSSDRSADAIVRSVIGLARNLDLHVVAEGVEDAASMNRLRELGCDEAQGYYFARPMSAADVEEFGRLADVLRETTSASFTTA